MHKTLLLSLLSLSVGVANVQAQSPATATARYAAVNRTLPQSKVVRLPLEGYSTEGGELTAYFQAGQPQKMVAKHFGESGRASEEYYFWKGQLFFILRTNWSYEIILGQPKAPGRETHWQERYYFQKGRLTRWTSEGKAKPIDTNEATMAQNNFLENARDFLGKAREKLKASKMAR